MSQTLLVRIRDILDSTTYGNSALKTLVDNIYARLGAPVGADLSADIAAVQADVTRLGAREVITGGMKVYPTEAAGVTVTGDAAAWTLGAFATVAAAAAIADDFYVSRIDVTGVSGAGTFELVLYHGAADTEFARIRFSGPASYDLRALKTIPGGEQVRAKLASLAGGAQTATVSFGYHTS